LKGVPAENGFDRVRYEIDRFLPAFAPPLRDENRLPSQTIQTPIGEFRDCEVITGTSKFDRPTRGEGYWKEDFVWTIALHPNAPFGVVRVICKSTGSEVNPPITVECTQSDVLTLTKTGRDAKNALPDSGEMNSPAVDSK